MTLFSTLLAVSLLLLVIAILALTIDDRCRRRALRPREIVWVRDSDGMADQAVLGAEIRVAYAKAGRPDPEVIILPPNCRVVCDRRR